MAGLPERIKVVREALGYSQTDFSKELEIPQSYLSAMETGKKAVHVRMYIKMHEKFNVDLNWVISGIGEMFISGNSSNASHPTTEKLANGSSLERSEVNVDLSTPNTPQDEKVKVVLWLSPPQLSIFMPSNS